MKKENKTLTLSKETVSMLLRVESNFDRRTFDPEDAEDDDPCYAYHLGITQGKAELARELLTPITDYRKKS